MKKMLIIMAAVIMLVGCSTVVRAEAASSSISMSFTVTASYGFTVSTTSLNLGNVKPGLGIEPPLQPSIICSSNHGKPWKLAINANPFSCGAATVPSDPGFKCSAWSSVGAEQAQGVFATFPMVIPAVQTDFYTSTLPEGSDQYVPITLGLYIAVPTTQVSGTYTTNLVLTMYD